MLETIEQKRARQREYARAKAARAAIAAGREPGRTGRPPVVHSVDEQAEMRARKIKRDSVASLKSRTAKRAAKALAEGRVPGTPGPKRLLVTEAAIRASRRAIRQRYRESHLEEIRATDVANSAARREKLKAENPEAYKIVAAANGAKMRVKTSRAPRGLTAIVRRVWEASEGKCAVCASDDRLELDHILAVTNGGTNAETNLQFLCHPCNRSKGKKDFQTWLASRAEIQGIAA